MLLPKLGEGNEMIMKQLLRCVSKHVLIVSFAHHSKLIFLNSINECFLQDTHLLTNKVVKDETVIYTYTYNDLGAHLTKVLNKYTTNYNLKKPIQQHYSTNCKGLALNYQLYVIHLTI